MPDIVFLGVIFTFAGSTNSSTDGVGTSATFNGPYGMAIDSAGSILVAVPSSNNIRRISTSGA